MSYTDDNTPQTPLISEPELVASDAESMKIELPEFEGPLDLLLHLIKKSELDILNIPISFIAEKYLEYIRLMEVLNLDVAGEYLLMAATLAYLKSCELVPQEKAPALSADENDDDGLDPRQELIRRLLEYQKYKEAAAQLGDRPVTGRNVWSRGMPSDHIAGLQANAAAPLEEVPVFRLIEALERVLQRARIKLTHEVVVDRISITDKINELVDRLARESTFTFSSCFGFLAEETSMAEMRHQVVITFLALLEMTRLHMLRMHQAADLGEIYLGHSELISPKVSTDE